MERPDNLPGVNTLGRDSRWNTYIHAAYRRHPKGLLVEFPCPPALSVPMPPLWLVTPPLVSSRRCRDRRSVLPSPSQTAAPFTLPLPGVAMVRHVVWYKLSLVSKNCSTNCSTNSSFPDPTHMCLAPMWFLHACS